MSVLPGVNYGTFRKKPVEVDAVQFTGEMSAHFIVGWCGGMNAAEFVPRGWEHRMRKDSEHDHSNGHVYEDIAPEFMVIKTLEGDHRADVGDWIIRGVAGEFYPCKPQIFADTYEAVS